jgi:diguanylate cyclase (GGDEF)-like protein/PAS domain S-box-containing protein
MLNSAGDLQKIIDLVPNPVFVKDAEHRWILLNHALAEMMGHPASELVGKSDFDVFPADEATVFWAADDELLLTGRPSENEERVTDAAGQTRVVVTRKCLIHVGPNEETPLIVGVLSDVTRYREAEARFRLLADHSTDLILCTDNDFRRRYVSPSVGPMLGYAPEEFLALLPADVIHPDDLDGVLRAYQRMRALDHTEALRYRYRHKDGRYLSVEGIGKRLADGSGFVITIRDVTHRLQIERRLRDANRQLHLLAMEDGLTGLANRRRFDERLEAEVGRAVRATTPVSLIMIDVDHFKKYNDTYGHVQGDACLHDVAAAVRATLRRPSDLAARYGGEEIAALLPDTDSAGATVVAGRICAAVRDLRREHAGSPLGIVTVSAGVATMDPREAADAEPTTLVSAADRALYEAKARGRDRVASQPALRL